MKEILNNNLISSSTKTDSSSSSLSSSSTKSSSYSSTSWKSSTTSSSSSSRTTVLKTSCTNVKTSSKILANSTNTLNINNTDNNNNQRQPSPNKKVIKIKQSATATNKMTSSTTNDQIQSNNTNSVNTNANNNNNNKENENTTEESMEVEETNPTTSTAIKNENQSFTLNDIPQLIKRPLKINDKWYVLDKEWYDKFLRYLEDNQQNPGPIDNLSLIMPFKKTSNVHCLKKNLEENINFVLIPEEAWKILVDNFDLAEGSQPLERQVISRTDSYLQVELYPLEIRLALYGSKQDTVLFYSRNCTLKQVINDMKTYFKISHEKPVQLWNNATLLVTHSDNDIVPPSANTQQSNAINPPMLSVVSNKSVPPPPPPPPPSSKTTTSNIDKLLLEIPDLEAPNPVLTIEVQNNDGTWPSSKTKLGAVTRSKLASGTPICSPGVCGLMNLGNTCFMNSAIQCLSNTERLTRYFLSDQHQQDINPDNPLGMRGEIAKNYAMLIKMMWSGYHPNVAPREFRMAVTQFAPQFSGFAHHDCQELMAFLLDGLHEDLNRVKVKPYIELKNDIEKRPDDIVAKEAWRNYKLRNDSIIVDTFHAQLKSTLVCPECELVSITFDPFCYLTLPLPYRIERSVDIHFIPASSKRPQYQIMNPSSSSSDDNTSTILVRSILLENVMIPKTGCISDISASVAKFLNECANNINENDNSKQKQFKRKFDPNKFVVASGDGCSHFSKFCSSNDLYNSVFNNIMVYEMDDLPVTINNETGCHTKSSIAKFTGHNLPVFIKQLNADQTEHECGIPFFITVKNLTYETIREAIFKELITMIKYGKVEEFLEDMERNIVEKRKVKNKFSNKRNPRDDGGSDGEGSDIEDDELIINNCNDVMIGSEDDDSCDSTTVTYPPYAIHYNDFSTQMPSILNPGMRFELTIDCYLVITINYRIITKYFKNIFMGRFSVIKLLQLLPSIVTNKANSQLTLNECINQFTLIEKLGENDPWYCPRCKKHQMASKKFDIWSLPNNLIIHLKRFSYSRLHRDKLNVLVDFPIENLDMSPYILNNPNNEKFEYELIAVSNHYGELGAGHYNAYAKNFLTNNWFLFDDYSVSPVPDKNKVVTKAAYVLFYQRKNININDNINSNDSNINCNSNDIQSSQQ